MEAALSREWRFNPGYRGDMLASLNAQGAPVGKIAAVANLKGGTGKSTIAVNLACELAVGGAAVALVDADEQGTATYWVGRGEYPVTLKPAAPGADPGVWAADIAALASEIVVIDAPPQIGGTTRAIIDIAHVVLIPALASTADIMATGKALALVRAARDRREDKGPKVLLVPSRVDRRTASGKEIEAVLHEFGEPVAPMVRQRTAFVDSFSAGCWIGAYARNSDAHSDIQALAAVVKRMLRHGKTT
ncbi:MAG TPA: ParA family protein [Stellaceae bacterium]|nr:ParA family protein [Stellaceae bacterium]